MDAGGISIVPGVLAAVAAASSPGAASGAYTYDVQLATAGTLNGTALAWQGFWDASAPDGYYASNFAGSGGSIVYGGTVPGANGNNYEVASKLALKTAGAVYIHFLRADAVSVQAGTGSYISVEVQTSSTFHSPGLATLVVNQSFGGLVTQLAAASITATDGMTLRSVVFGTNLWVFVNNVAVLQQAIPLTTGRPGIGGYGQTAGGFQGGATVGHWDSVAPGQVVPRTVSTSLYPQSVSVQWQGVADDASGTGVMEYLIARDGVPMFSAPSATFADATVAPSTSYTYTIQAVDFHGNAGAATSVAVTTPPAGSIDPRRTGIVNSGSYWGGGGEQIDMLGGNLNFALPLFSGQGRTGWSVPIGLSYNSQIWRRDGGTNWQLSGDVGYGLGWRMQVGSVTPYYVNWAGGVDHYVYTDSTGAEYRLDVNNGGAWSSTRGIYVWFDANTNILHFRDGMFWVMGCVSGGLEADAGTMYPTVVEDVGGNQVILTYETAAGLPWDGVSVWTPNTSSRLSAVEDVRARACPPVSTVGYANTCALNVSTATYFFKYDRTSYAVPHLVSITPTGAYATAFTFTYATGAVQPPFGSDPNWAGATGVYLATVPRADGSYVFSYDGSGSGEMTQVRFPWGGHLRWVHSSDGYSGGRQLRAVTGRYLAADAAGAAEWGYSIARDDASGGTLHATATIVDASGVGAKTWNFLGPQSGGNVWKSGLAWEFVQKASVGGTVYTDDTYTWATDADGNPYISAKVSVSDPGTSNAVTSKVTQVLDRYGNVVQSAVYPYNNVAAALRTYDSTYLGGGYLANYLRNKLVSTVMTSGGVATTLVANNYGWDAANYGMAGAVPVKEMDANPPVALAQRGYVATSTTPAGTTTYRTYPWGAVGSATGPQGTVQVTDGAATNYAAPTALATATYGETLAYNPWLQLTQSTGWNGETSSTGYDNVGRPVSAVSAGGYSAGFAYSPAGVVPAWQTKAGADGWTRSTLDGLGRAVLVERGTDANHIVSVVRTEYAPCACSPLGKLKRVPAPYAPGGSPAGWTTYVYDGLGRTVSVTQPDGVSATTYLYAGNQTTVTDPAGKWKRMVSDAEGNLVQVVEPDPANMPGGTLVTSYSYDAFKRLIGVSMPRGGVTQTRTFVYSAAGDMTSATNPENGTVLFTYNANHTLATKVDARGWKTVYTYDVQRRVTMTQSYPAGWGGVEDFAARVTYTYDTNAVEPGFTQYGTGRLVSAAYRVGGGSQSHAVTEMYSYTPGGQVASKKVLTDSCWNMVVDPYSDPPATVQACGYMQADTVYGWDGRLVNYTVGGNPVAGGPSFSVATDRDGMSRPVAVTATRPPAPSGAGAWSRVWARNAQYDAGGRLASYETLQYVWPGNYAPYDGYTTRTMGYNVNGQLASEGWSGTSGGVTGSVTYSYAGGANNGQISQVVDSVSGETVTYAYDALKRLVSAVSGGWTQTYQYDGFGNLTGRVLNGVPTSIAADAATNRLVGAGYDAAGNMVSGMGASFAYDGGNRLVSAAAVSGGAEYYGYAPDNKRIYTVKPDGSEEWTLFGARGEELGTFAQSGITGAYVDLQTVPVWFAGRIVGRGSPGSVDGIGAVFPDRLGTERVAGPRRKPYGEDAVAGVRFATYSKDGFSGLLYADQRWYAGGYGRFVTADRYKSSSASKDPGGWNKYGYTQGDPINRFDPHGTFWCDPEIDDTCYDPCDDSINGFSPSCGGGGGGNPPPVEPDPPVVDPGPECQASISDFPTGATNSVLIQMLLVENSWGGIGRNQYVNGDKLSRSGGSGSVTTVATIGQEDGLMLDVIANLAAQNHKTILGQVNPATIQGLGLGDRLSAYEASAEGSSECNDLMQAAGAVKVFAAGNYAARTAYNQWRAVVQTDARTRRNFLRTQHPGDLRVGFTDFFTVP